MPRPLKFWQNTHTQRMLFYSVDLYKGLGKIKCAYSVRWLIKIQIYVQKLNVQIIIIRM